MEVYRDIRADLIEIYVAAYHSFPEVQYAYKSWSISALQERADEQAVAARNYDPTQAITDVQQFFGGIYKTVEFGLVVLFLISTVFASGLWYVRSLIGLQFLASVPTLTSLIIGGSSTVALFSCIVLIYARLLTASSIVVQSINQELAIGAKKTKTRIKPRLVGYIVWNSSLNGGKAIRLLATFSVLKLLSITPWWDPYQFTYGFVKENIDTFVGVDGYYDAVRRALERLREEG